MWTPGSHIMAIEVSGYKIHNLSNPVIITFQKPKANKHKKKKFSCVFWDISIGGKVLIHLVKLSSLPYAILRKIP